MPTASPCPDENALLGYVRAAGQAKDAGIERHVAGCEGCRAIVAELARGSLLDSPSLIARSPTLTAEHGMAAPMAAPAPGSRFGRYVVEARLGEGGMGIVYAARDPALDRRVALKLLRPEHDSPEARARLSREAQALARLSHPNIVQVHDVGEQDGTAFIAMELVDGVTLGAHLRAHRASWREALSILRDAGQGLAAAHDAGIVHRDFKPDNVLISREGRVRVTDFGLARAANPAAAHAPPGAPVQGTLASELTQPGGVLGTPAYMAPEQFEGQVGDARSDQFSFCVSLHEALYGLRPFAGTTWRELAAAARAGTLVTPPAGARVPPFVRTAMLRALAARPQDRFPSMRALLDALERDPAARRRRAALGLAGVAMVALLVFGANQLGRKATPAPCTGLEQRLTEVWGTPQRDALRAAFAATGHALGAETADAVSRTLDAHGQTLVGAYVEACRATRVRGEQSEELLDLRVACLDDRRRELGAVVELLSHVDAKAIEKAPNAAASLGGLAACADRKLLATRLRPPGDPALAPRIRATEERLAAASALQVAGRYADALAAAKAAVADARAIGWRPLEARALLRQGVAEEKLGDGKAAEATLVESARAADAGRDLEGVALARIGLVVAVGDRRADVPRGQAFAKDAAAAIEGLGGSDELSARLSFSWAAILRKARRLAEARSELERAARGFAKVHGPGSLDLARTELNLANVAFSELRFPDARAAYEKALPALRDKLGPRHPQVAAVLGNLGAVQAQQSEFAAAAKSFDAELAIEEATLGAEHPSTAETRMNFANALVELGRREEAIGHYRAAVRVQEARLGEHPQVATTLNNLGIALWHLGRHDEALPVLRRALALRERVLGPKHPDVAVSLNQLGSVLLEQGHAAEAQALHRRALAIQLAAPERDELEVATTHCDLAAAARRLRKALVAKNEATQCLSRRLAVSPDQPDVPDALDALARAEAALGKLTAAEEHWARAIELETRHRGKAHVQVGRLLLSLGVARLDAGHADRALDPLARCLDLLGGGAADPAERGEALFALARATVLSGGDRARARSLAERALAELRRRPQGAGERKRIEAWLADLRD